MSNSNLVCYTRLLPHYRSRNGNEISKITIHHMASNLSIETCSDVFGRTASSNYGIGIYVEEV